MPETNHRLTPDFLRYVAGRTMQLVKARPDDSPEQPQLLCTMMVAAWLVGTVPTEDYRLLADLEREYLDRRDPTKSN